MTALKKQKIHARKLILGHLERISSKVFSDFPKQVTDLIGREHGIYALYKNDRLYYVGLATNLKGRIKRHREDRHAGKWDRFSLYLVRRFEHINELESLILRIADPTGNLVKGRLSGEIDLRFELESLVSLEQNKRRKELFGERERRGKLRLKKRRTRKTQKIDSEPPLKKYVGSRRFRIKGWYKDKVFDATVHKNGKITLNRVLYNTPSAAGVAARKRSTNGWTFWHFRSDGEWITIDHLRERR